jgi:hypothetical protein
MAVQYTDVDLMLLNRWQEVSALRAAFNELLGRMGGVVETACQRASNAASERGFRTEFDARKGTFAFWKQGWENRKKDAAIYALLSDFAPEAYYSRVEDHPVLWLLTEDFPSLKVLETPEHFGKELRNGLSQEQRARWNHDEFELQTSPFGRVYAEVSDLDRVALASDPDRLATFLIHRVDEFAELVPLIDSTLARMTRK